MERLAGLKRRDVLDAIFQFGCLLLESLVSVVVFVTGCESIFQSLQRAVIGDFVSLGLADVLGGLILKGAGALLIEFALPHPAFPSFSPDTLLLAESSENRF